ncbi:MAG: xylulokinase [Succinivibrio sp.]|nr:xylulokinase [Succinivibrio sp.]
MKYLLGVDLGTSGTKTVLFSQFGEVVASASYEYPLYQPKNGWAEQDPEDWYKAAVKTIKTVLKKSEVNNEDIAGLSIAGQMHGLVMLDKKGEVLRRAILWCDSRTSLQCDEITQKVGRKRLIEITANPALTGFTAPKILWVRENEKDIYDKCAAILLPKDYVRYRLTGRLLMEISDASGTNLLDIKKREWSKEILKDLDIKPGLLPPLVESSAVAGNITKEAAKATGLLKGTIVAGGAGDNAAAAIGTGVCRDGMAFVTLGTSGVVFSHTSKPVIDPLGRVHTFCAAVPNAWTAISCTLAAGLSLRWTRDELYEAENKKCKKNGKDIYDLMTSKAAKVPVGSDGLIYLPYLMGERSPILDPDARGVFFGLSAMHTKAHMTRAVLEGITLSQRHNLHVLSEMGIVPEVLRGCGGGLASKVWRQMLADALKCKVVTTKNKEGPALGAAILAGVASGLFESVEQGCLDLVKTSSVHSKPDAENSAKYDEIYKLYTFLYPQLRPAFAKLADLRDTLSGNRKTEYKSVESVEFERYGKVIDGINTKKVISILKKTPLPKKGTVYEASEKSLELPDLMEDIQMRVFGGLKIQIGYCNGDNHTLNALEYHRNCEVNIAEKDTLIMVAPITAIRDGIIDSESVETFLVKAGIALQFYETTLHYCPCTGPSEKYFRMACILPKDTNTEKPENLSTEGEAGYLTNNNKWLFAHKDSDEGRSGITKGLLIGENITLKN